LQVKARIGEILRHWRAIRGVSQRELAERAGVSTRHLAFVENGKAHPSRDAVSWLARALKVPDTEEAAFLEAAGYLPNDRVEPAPDAAGVAALRQELEAMLARLEPHPALVHDVQGTILAANAKLAETVRPFVGDVASFIGMASGGHRLIAALRPHLVDPDGITDHYLRRVRDALLRGHGTPPPALVALFEQMQASDAATALDRRRPHPLTLRIAVRDGAAIRSYDALTTTLGTPMALALRALRLVILLRDAAASEVDRS
jgi:transcriptional regulator with XRE-family HTH domain